MSILDVTKSLNAKFEGDWTYTQKAWPDSKFETASVTEWVKLNVLHGESEQASAGASSNFYRSYGLVEVQIFVEQNSGAKRALELAGFAINIWRSLSIGSTVFASPRVVQLGYVGSWYQVNVQCDFYTDEII